MPLKGNSFNLNGEVAIPSTSTTGNGTTAQATATAVAGADKLTFEIIVHAYTSGTYTLVFNESDDSGMAGQNAVSLNDLDRDPADVALTGVGVSYVSYRGSKAFVTADVLRADGGNATFSVTAIKDPSIVSDLV